MDVAVLPRCQGLFPPYGVRQGENLPHVIGEGESAKGIIRPPRTTTYRSL